MIITSIQMFSGKSALTSMCSYKERCSNWQREENRSGMGMVHMATAGFLVVAYILERCEAISANKGACLSILKEMDKLARHVNELRKRPELKEGMVDSIREAIALIVEASIACSTQINAPKFSK